MIILVATGYSKKMTGFSDKTLWNWLELLIIPVVLAVGGLLFTVAQDERQDEAEDRRAEAQREAEEQRAQDQALQAYFEEMGSLLLDEDLRTSQEDDEASNDEASTLARARTLTILGRVDPERKSSVVQFLYESNLIQKDQPIVSLASADLSDVDLSSASLQGADLGSVDLSDGDDADERGANLSRVDLRDADLSSASLQGADLSRADLRDADLRDANLLAAYLVSADLSDGDDYNEVGAYLSDSDDDYDDRGANLSFADLQDADLSSAALAEANLRSANLKDAKGVTDEKRLEQLAYSLEDATMPDGSTHD